MTDEVLTCQATDALTRAAQIMWEQDCGCVPVVDSQGTLVGMVTDRDLCMAAYTSGQTLGSVTVDQAMTDSPAACRTSDDVEVALGTMAEKQVHRLPVLDGDRRLAGVLSLADALQAVDSKDVAARRKYVDVLVEALRAVTRPRRSRAQGAPVGTRRAAVPSA